MGRLSWKAGRGPFRLAGGGTPGPSRSRRRARTGAGHRPGGRPGEQHPARPEKNARRELGNRTYHAPMRLRLRPGTRTGPTPDAEKRAQPSRGRVALLAALIGGALTVTVGWLAFTGHPAATSRAASTPARIATRGLALCEQSGGVLALRVCYQRKILGLLEAGGDPAGDMPKIDAYVHSVGGPLDQECHMLMHWVGRQYGVEEHVTFAGLQDLLPRSNDPGCSAGFAHGLISSLGKDILDLGPKGALTTCEAAATRYRRYSCVHGLGHAYMRAYSETLGPALAACKALGRLVAADCAAGVFHDYWLALSGSDQAVSAGKQVTSPRALCGAQPAWAVRGCWFRASLEHPPAHIPDRARDLPRTLCRGLGTLQRAACVTGAMVLWGNDPYRALAGCAAMAAPADEVSCVRGVKAQALAGQPVKDLVRLVQGCSAFAAAARDQCARWLGTELQVVTDGTFAAEGCPPTGTFEAACLQGARASEGPLETFS